MKERRRTPRCEVVLRVRFQNKRAFTDAVAHSLGVGGLFLATDNPFDVGHRFQVEIDLPKKKKWICGTCEVMWISKVETKEYPEWVFKTKILEGIAPQQLNKGMGIKFIDLLPKYKKRIQEYLNTAGKT